jgi:hypothetical protein
LPSRARRFPYRTLFFATHPLSSLLSFPFENRRQIAQILSPESADVDADCRQIRRVKAPPSLLSGPIFLPSTLSVPQGIDAENLTDAVQPPAASPLLCSTQPTMPTPP